MGLFSSSSEEEGEGDSTVHGSPRDCHKTGTQFQVASRHDFLPAPRPRLPDSAFFSRGFFCLWLVCVPLPCVSVYHVLSSSSLLLRGNFSSSSWASCRCVCQGYSQQRFSERGKREMQKAFRFESGVSSSPLSLAVMGWPTAGLCVAI